MTLPTEPRNGDFASYVEALSRAAPATGQSLAKPAAPQRAASQQAAQQSAPSPQTGPVSQQRRGILRKIILAVVLWATFSRFADALRAPFDIDNYLPAFFLLAVACFLAPAWRRNRAAGSEGR